MPLLYHSLLCPHSRFIRLVTHELSMEIDLQDENIHARRREFLMLNPAGETPVLVEHDGQVVPGGDIIAEYLDETRGLVLGERRLLPEEPSGRVEVRRLMRWFGTKFSEEVSGPLVHEKITKRIIPVEQGGGSPDPNALRAARSNIRYHLKYIGHLLAKRNWIANDRMTYADLVAAAHLSVVDYLGDVPWEEDESAKEWYARLKSRPSFRPLLADRLRGMPPSAHYVNLDF